MQSPIFQQTPRAICAKRLCLLHLRRLFGEENEVAATFNETPTIAAKLSISFDCMADQINAIDVHRGNIIEEL